jgi:hypothetical protein
VLKQGKEGAGRWAPATVPGGGGLNILQIQTNSNYLKTFRTLTDPKTTLPSPKNEIKYGFEGLKKMNNFLHRIFFIFEWISNEKSENSLG